MVKSTASSNCRGKPFLPLLVNACPMQLECCIKLLKTSQDPQKPCKPFSCSCSKIYSLGKQQSQRGHQGTEGAITNTAGEQANCQKDRTRQSKIGNQICPSKFTNLHCLYSKLTYLNLKNKGKLRCKQKEIAKMQPQKSVQT